MKLKRDNLIYIVIISTFVLFLTILILNSSPPNAIQVSESFAVCVGENSLLYVQEGCSACEIQEEMFGQHYGLLDTLDCIQNPQACSTAEISATPTWIINEQKYVGVQYPDRLSDLTGCAL